MILQIFIPGVPKNANARSQWAKYATNADRQKFRKATRDIGLVAVQDWHWTPATFTHIVARQVSPVRRRRDPLGLAERLKGILDGLVDAGVLPDDDEDHVTVTLAKSIRGDTAGIQLTLCHEDPNAYDQRPNLDWYRQETASQ